MFLYNLFPSICKSKILRKVPSYTSDRLMIANIHFVCIFFSLFQYQPNFFQQNLNFTFISYFYVRRMHYVTLNDVPCQR